MHPCLYKILRTHKEGNYLYEIVECSEQLGVRCRIYLTKDELFGDSLYKYDNTKFGYHFRKFLNKRHPEENAYKFEAFAWCWPCDEFDENIGKEKAFQRVNAKIKSKRNKINRFIRTLEKNNLSKKFKIDKI